MARHRPAPLGPCDYGSARERRKEGAMLAVQLMLHRLRVCGYSARWSNKDLINAFPSISWRLLAEANRLLLDLDDQKVGADRFRAATICLPARDRTLI
eukprot:1959427-Pyramimonas_sp.AAC.1